MGPDGHTDMGGMQRRFLTTHWSLIQAIGQDEDQDKDQALIDLLIKRYWKPVYCFLRRRGFGNEQAKDLTQGFFHDVVLGRQLIQKADPTRGRFRSFLLHALNQFLIDRTREHKALKRIPRDRLVSLDTLNPEAIPQTVSHLAPEDSFNYVWKTALLDQVLSEVEKVCRRQEMEIHWKVFHDRVVKPILENIEAPSLTEICSRYAVEDEAKASNMIVTAKRRFQSELRKHIRNTVLSESQVDEELSEILKLFPEKAQDSKKTTD